MHNMPHTEDSKMKMSAAHIGIPNFARRRETIEENGVTLYRCGKCGEFKPYDAFYKNKRTILGITSECKKCHCETSYESRNVENSRRINREYMKGRRENNPEEVRAEDRERNKRRPKDEKYRARRILNNAVKRGEIRRPTQCEICGAEGVIHGHHPDYSRPLDVEWLCSECHGKRHRKIEFERCEKPKEDT